MNKANSQIVIICNQTQVIKGKKINTKWTEKFIDHADPKIEANKCLFE